jgi:UDP-arabinose 4-epimerase
LTKKIIVTGGAGYIGLHTAKALEDSGFIPVVIDLAAPPKSNFFQKSIFCQGDIGDTAFLDQILSSHKPEAVIHMAASAEVGESARNPEKYYKNNVAGTLNLLSALKRHKIDKLVLSSTCAVYGEPSSLPIREDSLRIPTNVYGRTKHIIELMIEDFARSYGMSFIGLRYFNVGGAHPSGDIGENHDPETHLIPRALMASAGLIPALDIYGDDYQTEDGTCIRDYIHVCDTARAHVSGIAHLLNGGNSAFLNIGTGRGFSVKEILNAVTEVTGKTVPINIKPRREGDIPVLVGDTAQAKSILGFSTDYNDITEIVSTAWNYHRSVWS